MPKRAEPHDMYDGVNKRVRLVVPVPFGVEIGRPWRLERWVGSNEHGLTI